MTKDEALKLALEALQSCEPYTISDGGRQWHDDRLVESAIIAIKEALAQPEQEPSDFMLRDVLASELKCWHRLTDEEAQNLIDFIKHTSPPQRKPEQSPVSGVVIRDNFPTLLLESDVKLSDIRLYTSPPQRKPLTDEQRREVYKKVEAQLYNAPNKPWLDALIEQTEAAHGIKGDA